MITNSNPELLMALRDLVLAALEQPPEQEASAETQEALTIGLLEVLTRGGEIISRRPRPTPHTRPATLALAPPKGKHWTIVRPMPAGVKPGQPVMPLPLNANGKTYLLHVGCTYLEAGAWDGEVPSTLAAEYASGAIVVHAPGTNAGAAESFPLLWSRARSIAFGLDRMSHADAAAAKPLVAAEVLRIAARIPKSGGEMSDSIRKLAAMFNPPKAGKFDKPEGFLSAKNRQHAKRAKAIAAGENPNEAELIAAHMPNAQQGPVDYSTNSFGKVSAP